ncbi:recombinase family protein [Nocardioides baculatus]|uniref:Recombinase family protein n=1 Tax=Nocardioides baculatus TaxID=2801337 RepID=A0ABS1LFY2_9ACTN|nr:recombinase family protein [Nocardioides baculatus]MBL0749796.1 recombinase family protein [Nocardioides baculatus]
MTSPAPKRALIYTRISRDDTGEGIANQRQEEDCRKLADLRRWEVVGIEQDISISATGGKKRPGWLRVLDRVERGEADVILAWHIDRLTRSMADLQTLLTLAEEKNLVIATVSGDIDLSTDTGRLIAEILTAVAGAEVRRKGARQKRANQQRAAKGLPWKTGFRAFGYTLDGQVVEEEAALVRQAAEDVLNGTPLRGIVRRWKALEVPTARNRKNTDGWTHNSVRSILLNPRNAGIATYKGVQIGKGQWEAILSEETFVLLVATLTDPSRTKGEKVLKNKPANLLSGVATCGECGWKVEAGSSNGSKVYKCTNQAGDHIATDRADADDLVRSAFASAVALTLPGTVTDKRDATVPQDLWTRRQRLTDRLNMLATTWANGTLTDGQLETASEVLKGQLVEVDEQIEKAAELAAGGDLRSEDVRHFLTLDMWGQRKVLEELTEIKLWPKNRKRNVSIRQQVTVQIHDKRGRAWPALDDRSKTVLDPSAAAYSALAALLVDQQPEGVTTLAKAAQWLVERGHTDRSPAGLPGKLSPLVRYVRGETRPTSGWTRKGQAA